MYAVSLQLPLADAQVGGYMSTNSISLAQAADCQLQNLLQEASDHIITCCSCSRKML